MAPESGSRVGAAGKAWREETSGDGEQGKRPPGGSFSDTAYCNGGNKRYLTLYGMGRGYRGKCKALDRTRELGMPH